MQIGRDAILFQRLSLVRTSASYDSEWRGDRTNSLHLFNPKIVRNKTKDSNAPGSVTQ